MRGIISGNFTCRTRPQEGPSHGRLKDGTTSRDSAIIMLRHGKTKLHHVRGVHDIKIRGIRRTSPPRWTLRPEKISHLNDPKSPFPGSQ